MGEQPTGLRILWGESLHAVNYPIQTVGERTPDRLRAELRGAEAVLGIIAPDTSESSYVLFELGAAWSHGILTCPLLVRGATSPIRDLNPLSLNDQRDCHQLLDGEGIHWPDVDEDLSVAGLLRRTH
ncbi:MAG: hypothetical protein ACREXS_03860 [Gammaproteobacteria bacterium]